MRVAEDAAAQAIDGSHCFHGAYPRAAGGADGVGQHRVGNREGGLGAQVRVREHEEAVAREVAVEK